MQKDLLVIPEQHCGSFQLRSQSVSFNEETASLKKRLSKEEYELFAGLYSQKDTSPKKILRPLEELKTKHPNIPEIYNLLTFVYLKLKKLKKGELLIIEAYKKCPDNIFVKINYADHCLRKKRPQAIPEIFNNAFDLTTLYPSRKVFHFSEFRGFMTLMGFYHLSIQQKDKAACYHYLVRKVAPCHRATLLLGRKLYYTPILKRIFTRFK